MIESISVSNVSTYPAGIVQLFDKLGEFNYIYGANGSGKTSVSRVLQDPAAHPACSVTWKNGDPLDVLVYNRDFVAANFESLAELKGVFTLGEENVDNVKKIKALGGQIDALEKKQTNWRFTLRGDDGEGGYVKIRRECETRFVERCWTTKVKFDQFKPAFVGLGNSKVKFAERVRAEAENASSESVDLEYLNAKAATVFDAEAERESKLSRGKFESIVTLEADPILSTVVVGKKDVDIAAMIDRLGNSDWVRSGREFFANNDNACPFCQQETPKTLEKSFEEYFDQTFLKNTDRIRKVGAEYRAAVAQYLEWASGILENPSRYLDYHEFDNQVELFKAVTGANFAQLEQKEKEPSRKVDLESITPICNRIAELVDAANLATDSHNRLVDNLAKERQDLAAKAWRYLVDVELKTDVEQYYSELENIDKAVAGLNKQIADADTEIREKRLEVDKLERSSSTVRPTMSAINGLLADFGFESFSLAPAASGNAYKLVRADGSDAKTTLSEGERSFLTFLYFYHRAKGGDSESGIVSDRVIVLDDPVSSLDSEVLFIVSQLIKDLSEDVKNNGNIKQLFVFTHNVYFHKEVTYKGRKDRKAGKKDTFWMIRKNDGVSTVKNYDSNPIKSGYDLLWGEIRHQRPSAVTIRNTMRRILEQYFKMMGSADISDVVAEFTGKDKLICKSMISWLHDGSHLANDDLYVSIDDSMVDRYMDVFKAIFEKTGHLRHYEMMMGVESEAMTLSQPA